MKTIFKSWSVKQKNMWYVPRGVRHGICVEYFLSFPQKNCHQRKLRQTKCLLKKKD